MRDVCPSADVCCKFAASRILHVASLVHAGRLTWWTGTQWSTSAWLTSACRWGAWSHGHSWADLGLTIVMPVQYLLSLVLHRGPRGRHACLFRPHGQRAVLIKHYLLDKLRRADSRQPCVHPTPHRALPGRAHAPRMGYSARASSSTDRTVSVRGKGLWRHGLLAAQSSQVSACAAACVTDCMPRTKQHALP